MTRSCLNWMPVLVLGGVLLSRGVLADEIGFQAFEEAFNGISPAAPCLAVGPGHIVAVSNNGIRFFAKDGTMTYDNTFSGSYGFFPGGGTPFHPQTIYDPHTGRFIVAAFYRYAIHDFIAVAMSDDADPNGTWHQHTFGVDSVNGITLFDGDRVTLGVDVTAIYVHNDFYFASDPFDPFSHGFIFSIDKLALLNGQTPAVVAVEPFEFPSAIVPARTYDVDAPAQYFATPFGTYGFEDKIRLFALRDPLSSPVIDTLEVDVPPYDFLSSSDRMPHPGGGVTLSATDTRMRRAVYRSGSLWTAHHVRDPQTGRHLARWYEIRMNGWPISGELPVLSQAGQVDLAPDVHTFLPDIAPDDAGNAHIVFHHTSAVTPPAMARALHSAGDPPGHTQSIETLRETEVLLGAPTIYAACAAADIDPADAQRGWVGGTYWVSNIWGGRQPAMWVNSISPSLTLVGDLNCDGEVGFADINPFVLYLSDHAAWLATYGGCNPLHGDINGDGIYPSFDDINPFVALLSAQ